MPLDDLGEVRELYARVAPGRHGALDRDETWWRVRFYRDAPVAFLLDGPSSPAGWVIADLRTVEQPVGGARAGIRDWGGLPGTQAALLGLLGGYGPLDGVVTWSGPDPNPALLALPERSSSVVREPWMLRVVDVPAAFTARPYPAGVHSRVGFTVQDLLCPRSRCAWLLEVDGGQGQVERATAATASAHVRWLAALFTATRTLPIRPPRGCWEASTRSGWASSGTRSPPAALDRRALLTSRTARRRAPGKPLMDRGWTGASR